MDLYDILKNEDDLYVVKGNVALSAVIEAYCNVCKDNIKKEDIDRHEGKYNVLDIITPEFTRQDLGTIEYILESLLDKGVIFDDKDDDFTGIVAKARQMIEKIDDE